MNKEEDFKLLAGVDGIFLPTCDPSSDDEPTSDGKVVQVQAMLLIEVSNCDHTL